MRNSSDVPAVWLALLPCCVVLVPVEALVTFSLWFAPGWANGWPWPRRVVWSTGVAVSLFMVLMTCAVGAGAVYAIIRYYGRSAGRTRRTFAVWIASCAAVGTLVCVLTGQVLYSRAVGLWP